MSTSTNARSVIYYTVFTIAVLCFIGCDSQNNELKKTSLQPSVVPSVSHAITHYETAILSFIEAGKSGDEQAMLFSSLTEAEYTRQIEIFNRAGVITAEYIEFEREFQVSLSHWRQLIRAALQRSALYRGIGDRETESEIIQALRNIVDANSAEGLTRAGRLAAEYSRTVINDTVEERERLDP
jgi:hypothetical protein